jgi:hypothetical protein
VVRAAFGWRGTQSAPLAMSVDRMLVALMRFVCGWMCGIPKARLRPNIRVHPTALTRGG